MICNIQNNNSVFRIILFNRLNNNITYIFAGNVDNTIKNILKDYETNKNILKKNSVLLEQYYGSNYKFLFNPSTKQFKYIFEYIFSDDTINTIKKKIFSFIGNENNILLNSNQELWVKLSSGDYKILSNEYEHMQIKPSIFNKLEPDYKNFVSKDGNIIFSDELINNNLLTLYDATNGLKFISNNIYCNNLEFELKEISVYQKPIWFLDGIQILKELTEFSIKRDVNWKAMEILEFARKKTTQKVNLYEKVQIPEFNQAISKIKRFLEDEENLSKSAQKILKRRNEKASQE